MTEMQNGCVVMVKLFNIDGAARNVITYSCDEFNQQTGSVEMVGGATSIPCPILLTLRSDRFRRPSTVNGRTTTYAYDIPNRKRTITRPGNRVVRKQSLVL